MKKLQRSLALFLSLLMTLSCMSLTAFAQGTEQEETGNPVGGAPNAVSAEADTISIVPQPNFLEEREGTFTLDESTQILYQYDDPAFLETAEFLRATILQATGWELALIPSNLRMRTAASTIQITSTSVSEYGEEGYVLEVTPTAAIISSYGTAGAFYGVQSFLQLLPTEIFSTDEVSGIDWTVPCVYVKDKPAQEWRGFMLDTSRQFWRVDEIKRVLDNMAYNKLNRLHLHLTDDNGWRLEIPEYPALTEVGSIQHSSYADNGKALYYTEQDIKDIVAYAAERHIEVIPEVDMPGHFFSAVKSIPEVVMCNGDDWAIPLDDLNIFAYREKKEINGHVPEYDKWVHTTMCVGKPKAKKFRQDVIDQLCKLFPSEYIHIGGDEVWGTGPWEQCPDCNAIMQQEGYGTDYRKLEYYVAKETSDYIKSKGKQAIGWSEIFNNGTNEDITLMDWIGGLSNALKNGSQGINANLNGSYLDYPENKNDNYTESYGGYIPLEKAYNFEVVPSGLTPEEQDRFLGVQGNMWTHVVRNEEQLNYCIFPRLSAIAERGWTEQVNRDYADFESRMAKQYERMNERGVNYNIPEPRISVEDTETGYLLSIDNPTGKAGKVYYTLDGTVPTSSSNLYEGPVELPSYDKINAKIFVEGRSQTGKSYSEVVTFENPVQPDYHHWKFDGNANEEYGGYNGTIQGVPAFAVGHDGTTENGAIVLDEIGEYITLNRKNIEGDWTLSVWVKRLADSKFSFLMGGGGLSIRLTQWTKAEDPNKNHVGIDAASYFDYSAPQNEWAMLTMTHTGDTTKLYVDGVYNDAITGPTGTLPMGMIGCENGYTATTPLGAELDDLWIFRRVLTDDEIAALAKDDGSFDPEGTPEPAPAVNYHHWTFDGDLEDEAGTLNGSYYTKASATDTLTYTDGRNGVENGAVLLDSKTEAITLNGQSIAADPGWTFSAWVYENNKDSRFGFLTSSGASALRLRSTMTYDDLTTKYILVTDSGAKEAYMEDSVPLEKWTMLTFVGTADGVALYVDGKFKEDAKPNPRGSALNSGIPLPLDMLGNSFAWSDLDSALNAALDDVWVIERPLSEGEIQDLFNGSFDPTADPNAGFEVNASAGNGGKVTPETATVQPGGTCVITITPDAGYVLKDVTLDGDSVMGRVQENQLTLTDVQKDCTIEVTFEIDLNQCESYWKFDGNANDEKNVRNGTLMGEPTFVTDRHGVNGNAIELSAENQYVLTDSSALDGDWSVNVWVNRIAAESNYSFLLGGGGLSVRLTQWPSTLKVGIGAQEHFGASVPLNEWVMLTLTHSGDNTKMYLDGKKIEKEINGQSGSLPLKKIGAENGYSTPLGAQLDDMRVYSGVLNEDQVRTLFESEDYERAPYEVVSCEELDGCTVASGAKFDELMLPDTVSVTVSNGNRTDEVICGVTWTEPENFAQTTGRQIVYGELTNLPEGVQNTGNVKAEYPVTVSGTVAAPSADPIPGTYPSSLDVTLSCATENAEIYYSTDGSLPATLYTAPIAVTETTTIKAIAYCDGLKPSSVVEFVYTIDPTVVISVTGVELDETELTLTEGDTATLTATVLPTYASNKNVTWTSDDKTVATVVDGVVTAVAAGTATITVTTEDGSHTADCSVTVEAKSSEKQITSFVIEGGATEIDEEAHTITVTMPFGTTDVTALAPTIAVSDKATVDPVSGEAQDFTNTVLYTVTAEDGSTQEYVVTVTVAEEEIPVTKEALEKLVNEAKALNEADYTEESWAAFETALTAAETVLGDADATQEEVNAAKTALEEAIAGLTENETPAEVDKTELQNVYDEYKDTANEDYTEESWNAFQNALTAAEAVLADDNATQDEVDAVKAALEEAIAGLIENETPVEVDKTELQSVYDQYKDTANDNYTEESWSAFQNALTAAAAVLADDTATQAEVDAAEATLKNAYEGLTKNEEQPPVEEKIPVEGVELDEHRVELYVGDRFDLNAYVYPENADNQEVIWETSDPDVVRVNSDGRIKAVGEGKAIITVTTVDGGYTDSCRVIVEDDYYYDLPVIPSNPNRPITLPKDKDSNGTVSSDHKNAHTGDKVTITVDPDEGYEVDEIVITDKDGNEIDFVDNGDNTYTFTMPDSKVEIEVSYKAEEIPLVKPPFVDVNEGDAYYVAVSYVYTHGIMNGTGETEFAPNATTTRAMIWTILARMSGENVDGGTPWYANAQEWAMSTEVSDGTDPNGIITREMLVTMMYRFAGSPEVGDSSWAALTGYADGETCADWSAKAMAWAVGNGFIDGVDGKLSPKTGATRATVAEFLMRYLESVAK